MCGVFTEAPQITVIQSEILIGLGDTTVMECTSTGIPHPQIHWYKGEGAVPTAQLSFGKVMFFPMLFSCCHERVEPLSIIAASSKSVHSSRRVC